MEIQVKRLGFWVAGCSWVVLITGCGWFGNNKSVQDIYIDDNSANAAAIQFNYHHPSGRNVTQLELQKVKFEDQFSVRAATAPDGQGEERLRNTSDQDLPQNQFVGTGNVNASYELIQASARHIFKLDANGHFQIDLAPEVALMQLDSEYTSGNRRLSLDMDKLGAGVTFTTRWQFADFISLNASGNHNFYERNTRANTHMLFLRFQPTKRFYLDIGKYVSDYDFGSDTHISYERRVPQIQPCFGRCEYVYDGTQDSDLEIDARGYRLGVGVDF